MTPASIRRAPRHRAASACEVIEIRRVTTRPPAALAAPEDEVTNRMYVVPTPPPGTAHDTDDYTRIDHLRSGTTPLPAPSDSVALTSDHIAELKRRLAEAEAREEAAGSGVRLRPTPPEGVIASVDGAVFEELESVIGEPLDLDIDVEPPRSFGEWTDELTSLPELEVALAPNSDSNFYAGFDSEHPDGVFLATYRDLPVDTPVYAVVHLPAGYRFRTPALVEFVREPEAATPDAPAGVGLRMCGLDPRMRRLIREFAKERAPLFYVG